MRDEIVWALNTVPLMRGSDVTPSLLVRAAGAVSFTNAASITGDIVARRDVDRRTAERPTYRDRYWRFPQYLWPDRHSRGADSIGRGSKRERPSAEIAGCTANKPGLSVCTMNETVCDDSLLGPGEIEVPQPATDVAPAVLETL